MHLERSVVHGPERDEKGVRRILKGHGNVVRLVYQMADEDNLM